MDSDSDSDSGQMDSDSHLMDSDSGLMDSDSDSDSGLVDSDSLPDSRVRTHSNTVILLKNNAPFDFTFQLLGPVGLNFQKI